MGPELREWLVLCLLPALVHNRSEKSNQKHLGRQIINQSEGLIIDVRSRVSGISQDEVRPNLDGRFQIYQGFASSCLRVVRQ